MAGEPRLKGPIGVTLGVTASLLLVAAAWSFVALARSLSGKEREPHLLALACSLSPLGRGLG